MKKIWMVVLVLIAVFCTICIVTNPTEADYIVFMEERTGRPIPDELDMRIERTNFYLFSTYTPVIYSIHPGATYLGIMGKFYKISGNRL